MLQNLATVTGGRYRPTVEQLLQAPTTQSAGDPPLRTASRPVPLWPWLLAAAAVLFVFDVAFRRIDLTLWSWPRRWLGIS